MKNKIGTALLALLISFSLWLFVVSVVDPEAEQTYYNVPVVFSGNTVLEDRGLVMTSQKDVKVTLTLSGTRSDLNHLNNTNITVIADLSNITSAGEHLVNYSISYPGTVTSGGITVQNQTPQQLTVTVKQWEETQVPVDVVFTGAPPSSDYVPDRDNPVLDHSTVTISGPKDVVDQVKKAVVTVDLTGQTKDFSQTCDIVLCDEDRNPIEGAESVSKSLSKLQVTTKVNKLKTVDIQVNVIPGGGLEAEDISFILDRQSITVSGPEDIVDALEIILDLDLGQLTESKAIPYQINLPAGVTNVTGIKQVHLEVKIPQLTTKTFTVTADRFYFINVPEGMEVKVWEEFLEIEIRGRENRLALLRPENIRITIDFSEAPEGSSEYTVMVEIPNYLDVGAVGTYKVTATVSVAASSGDSQNTRRP